MSAADRKRTASNSAAACVRDGGSRDGVTLDCHLLQSDCHSGRIIRGLTARSFNVLAHQESDRPSGRFGVSKKVSSAEQTAFAQEMLYKTEYVVESTATTVPQALGSSASRAGVLVQLPGDSTANGTSTQSLELAKQAVQAGYLSLSAIEGSSSLPGPLGSLHGAVGQDVSGLSGLMKAVSTETGLSCTSSSNHAAAAAATGGVEMHLMPTNGNEAVAGALQLPNDAYPRATSCRLRLVEQLVPIEPDFIPGRFSLVPQPRGALANLLPKPASADSLAEGQIAVAVKAIVSVTCFRLYVIRVVC